MVTRKELEEIYGDEMYGCCQAIKDEIASIPVNDEGHCLSYLTWIAGFGEVMLTKEEAISWVNNGITAFANDLLKATEVAANVN